MVRVPLETKAGRVKSRSWDRLGAPITGFGARLLKKRHEKAALMNEEMARFLEKHREELSRGKMPQELPKMSGISRWAREQVNPRPEAHVLHRQRIDATIYLLHGRAKAHGLEVFALNQFLEARKKVGGGPKFRKPPL